ncbi:MAG: FtsX-like permease family protein, partial [Longimicrobiales bacterium]
IQPLAEAYAVQTARPRFAAYLMGLFSVLAVVLACVGIYGVLTFAVGQRAKEIAIRRAIGASGSSVAARVVADGVKLAAVGLVVGSLAAVLGGRVLESFLFGVRTADPLTLVTVGGIMLTVAIAAAFVPAIRAIRRQPGELLGAD